MEYRCPMCQNVWPADYCPQCGRSIRSSEGGVSEKANGADSSASPADTTPLGVSETGARSRPRGRNQMKIRCPECEALDQISKENIGKKRKCWRCGKWYTIAERGETDMSNKHRPRTRDLLWGIVGFVVGSFSCYSLVVGEALSPLASLLGTIVGFGVGVRYTYRGIISFCTVPSAKIRLLVVMLVMIPTTAFLAIPFLPRLFRSHGATKVEITRAMMAQVEAALYRFREDCGRLPNESEGGLSALVNEPPGLEDKWNGPYLKQSRLLDIWGHPFVYSCDGEYNANTFDLVSFGADGQKGGKGEDADLIND